MIGTIAPVGKIFCCNCGKEMCMGIPYGITTDKKGIMKIAHYPNCNNNGEQK